MIVSLPLNIGSLYINSFRKIYSDLPLRIFFKRDYEINPFGYKINEIIDLPYESTYWADTGIYNVIECENTIALTHLILYIYNAEDLFDLKKKRYYFHFDCYYGNEVEVFLHDSTTWSQETASMKKNYMTLDLKGKQLIIKIPK